MELEKKLEVFKKIEKVDVPPFLFTKIMHHFNERKKLRFSKSFSWAFALAVSLLFILNITICIKIDKQTNVSEISSLANSLELGNNNTFYHDQN